MIVNNSESVLDMFFYTLQFDILICLIKFVFCNTFIRYFDC